MTRRHAALVMLAASTTLGLTACGERNRGEERINTDSVATTSTSGGTLAVAEEVEVESIKLGRSVGDYGAIADETNEFRPTDTIVAVVQTGDKDAGKELLARWTYGDKDQVVAEQRETIAVGNEARTTFRLSKSGAWPAGGYRLHILYNDREISSAQFTVK